MTIRECYEKMGSDYSGLLGRLGSEKIIAKFAVKFLGDPSFSQLESAVAEGRAEDAFRAAHTLKGVCLNLGFDKMYGVSSALTEKLRGCQLVDYEELLRQVEEQYKMTTDVLKEYMG